MSNEITTSITSLTEQIAAKDVCWHYHTV